MFPTYFELASELSALLLEVRKWTSETVFSMDTAPSNPTTLLFYYENNNIRVIEVTINT
jgi:hypothetical protein